MAITAFKLLKRGSLWCNCRSTLRTICNMYIKSVLKYCGEIHVKLNQSIELILQAIKYKPIKDIGQ